jgi:NAD(P)-dependent dehydrogenase (short-subunit alcohol dehydrogenase family)
MKTAIITGGGSGIGLAVARALAAERFRVGLIGRRREPLATAAHAINGSGGECWWGAVDVRDPAAVGAFVDGAAAQSGRIDLLVNSAGVFELRRFEDTSLDLWNEILAINLTGAFICCQAVWPHIAGGQIINISSIAGAQAFEGNTAYSASKFGLIGLSEVLALEGQPRNIRVHVLCPGNTQTPAWTDKAPADVAARMMKPGDVADVVRWLAVSPPDVTFGRVTITPAKNPWD